MTTDEAIAIAKLYRSEIINGDKKKAADLLELISGVSQGTWDSYIEAHTGVRFSERFSKVKELKG